MLNKLKTTFQPIDTFITRFKYWIIGALMISTVSLFWQNVNMSNTESSAINEQLIDSLFEVSNTNNQDTIKADSTQLEDPIITVAADEEIDESLIEKDVNLGQINTARSGIKTLEVNDIRNIARTLKPKSISAQTLIDEVRRLFTQDNNSTVSGATLVQALKNKLPKKTQQTLIEQIDFVKISNNVIGVKLKNAKNVKLAFKNKKKTKHIKVYDNAIIKFEDTPSQVTADVVGFSYKHLGTYWKVKHIDIQQKQEKGTLDIQLKGKLRDIKLPTVKLGNLYRRVSK